MTGLSSTATQETGGFYINHDKSKHKVKAVNAMSNLQLKTLHTISTCNIKTAFIYHNIYETHTLITNMHLVHVHNYKLAYL